MARSNRSAMRAAGVGARLWRFASGVGTIVARAWPIDGPSALKLARIHGWLGHLTHLDVIPVPIMALDGRTLISLNETLWELAPWKPGESDSTRPPSATRVEATFSTLAAVHLRLAPLGQVGPSPGLLTRRDDAARWVDSDLDRLEAIVRPGPFDPIADFANQWGKLARAGLPALSRRLAIEAGRDLMVQPVLRDARPDHFLFTADRLTGLVDFGAMWIDSPATDLARLLNEWIGLDRPLRSVALAAYGAIRPISPTELEALELFEVSAAWLGPGRWLRWHFFEERAFDDPDAVRSGLERGLSHLFERFQRFGLRS